MSRAILAVALFLCFTAAAAARGPIQKVANGTAQAVAETMARLGKVGHFGGNPYSYEGCAMASSKESAYRNCCYANDRSLKTMDVGYAQDSRGYWFCCRRYSR